MTTDHPATSASTDASSAAGLVQYVGAGPGDPRLLTLAGLEALQAAQLVLADSEALVDLLRGLPEAHATDAVVQLVPGAEQRVAAVCEAAGGGSRVVRLVAGDPFLDGGAAAEAAGCRRAGLDVEVVPGVSPQTAVPEYAGLSLAGGHVHLVSLLDDPLRPLQLCSHGTSVVHATIADLPRVQELVAAAGFPADQPVVLTLDGGTTLQTSRSIRVGDLVKAARGQAAEQPLVVVVGADATADEQLDWFESKPLFGWRVLVPRTKEQAGEMVARLRHFGAHADEVPTIAVEPPRTPQQMDRAVHGLVEGNYEWVAFTSANAVRAVREKFEALGLDARAFSGLRVAAVGQQTARSLRDWGIVPDLVPSGEQSAAGLAREFPMHDEVLDPINRVFLPRADIATEALVAGLANLGWEVDDVVAYRTVRAAPPAADTREAIKTGKFDAVLFTSSSTVRNLVGIAGKPHSHTVVAAIGPQTSATCVEHGLEVAVVPSQPGAVELVDALADFARARRDEFLAEGRPLTKPSVTRRRRRAAGEG